ncbi:MAG TPA: L,D-transpeptidase, partial [Actinomycetota bacterium]|nr:L,D-transpeptidase [Actinomycetota bacterium]
MRSPSALRASWVATVVASVLALVTPVATSVTGSTEDPAPVATEIRSSERSEPFGGVAGAGAEAAAPSPPEPAEPGHLLVRVPRDMAVRANPSADASVVGTMPSGSKYYDVPVTAWVEEVSPDGRWGRVEIPYVWPRRHGWIPLRDLARRTTGVQVRVDVSEHRITVTRFGQALFAMPGATGAAVSPTPPGEYFVTDRIAFSGGSLGTFAFGISGIQPNLPPGWNGGNQLAIHGTNDPSSIGRSASAGCLRVSERSLDRLKPLL